MPYDRNPEAGGHHAGVNEDHPQWMGHVSFSDLKLKLIGATVAISGIEVLKYFVNVRHGTEREVTWVVIIHLTLLLSGVMFALMDRIAGGDHRAKRAIAKA